MKISRKLEEIRNKTILELYKKQYTAEELGKIFGLSTAQTYNIIKEAKLIKKKTT